MITKKQKQSKITIDLTGPNGNAFYLLGQARLLCKQLGFTSEETKDLLDEMMSHDYDYLVQCFDDAFGEFVILER